VTSTNAADHYHVGTFRSAREYHPFSVSGNIERIDTIVARSKDLNRLCVVYRLTPQFKFSINPVDVNDGTVVCRPFKNRGRCDVRKYELPEALGGIKRDCADPFRACSFEFERNALAVRRKCRF
jgi:hypothetical protein